MGVQIDEKHSWENHIEMICKKASVGIGAIRHIKPFVLAGTLQVIYEALVLPYFDYYSPLGTIVEKF